MKLSTISWEKESYIRLGLWLIIVLGVMLRLLLALISLGSNDIFIWYDFAKTIEQFGVPYMYDNISWFNHPPLMGYFAQAALRLANATGWPFEFFFKLSEVAADLLIMGILWRIWHTAGQQKATIALAVFSGSFVAILISAYHGNTDSLCVSLSFLAAYLFEQKRPMASGVALALAINVKVIPILLIPIFVISHHSRRDVSRFGIGLLAGLLPMALFFMGHKAGFINNIFNYNSNIERWGILLFLLEGKYNPAFKEMASNAFDYYIANGRYVILGLVSLTSMWQQFTPKRTLYEAVALCFAIFLIFAPGFGVQYLIYICPFLFAINLRWAFAYSCLAGIFAAMVYYSFWSGTFPWYSLFTTSFPTPAPLVGLLTWGLLIQFAYWSVARFIPHTGELLNTSE